MQTGVDLCVTDLQKVHLYLHMAFTLTSRCWEITLLFTGVCSMGRFSLAFLPLSTLPLQNIDSFSVLWLSIDILQAGVFSFALEIILDSISANPWNLKCLQESHTSTHFCKGHATSSRIKLMKQSSADSDCTWRWSLTGENKIK